MARTRTSGFTVEGTGHFPIDMLRYDQCFPASEGEDSHAIDKSFMRGARERGAYQVTLITINESAPTVGRWESFGFRVVRESFKVGR